MNINSKLNFLKYLDLKEEYSEYIKKLQELKDSIFEFISFVTAMNVSYNKLIYFNDMKIDIQTYTYSLHLNVTISKDSFSSDKNFYFISDKQITEEIMNYIKNF